MILQPTMSAVDAYRAAMDRLDAGRNAEATGPSAFRAMLESEVGSAVQALKSSEATSLDALVGRASVQEVVEAVTAAELSLQKVTAVRDRVIAAYQEIIRMPI